MEEVTPMKKVILFIAMSLDGYIAKRDGCVDWLQGQELHKDDMKSYESFIKNIDTVVLGWNTYEQVRYELSPDEWMYKDLKSYVMTHREVTDSENISFINQDVCEFIKEIKQDRGKDIWICGGANIIQPLIKNKVIDRFHISIIPTILGDGISLFETLSKELPLKLIKTQSYNGITDVLYEYR